MKPITVVIPYSPEPFFEKTLSFLTKSVWIEEVVIVSQGPVHGEISGSRVLITESLSSSQAIGSILEGIRTPHLLFLPNVQPVSFESKGLERFLQAAGAPKTGIVYSSFYDESRTGKTLHPLNDYQLGSVCDDFDFGPLLLFSIPAIRRSLKKYPLIPGTTFAGLYDLRLKVSIGYAVAHLSEPLYTVAEAEEISRREKIFAYVDPQNRAIQREMEIACTDYLKKIGAYLPPVFRTAEPTTETFPVEASVVIPVRNRKGTIAEAVRSAFSQQTDFSFNVIVVDNHSNDGTTAILTDLARRSPNLIHIVPKRTDLGIGGCWNEALQYEACGRYVVQLDSDDLYSSPLALQKLVHMLRQTDFGMVIGSYTLVDSELKEIPPGLIDHREWTEENGHNNALRVNGLGAPRAFRTDLMRKIRFPNVSYGEDYAAALRICREYRIGRIYEGLYLCRRWPGNSDSGLTIEAANQNDAFKDKIRTTEIRARQKMNQSNILTL
ncbi:MAG: glycosyltransferase family 2 protein [Thermodesulfobacteriota bacterium]